MFNRIIHTFHLMFWYFLVPKHNAPCQDLLHTPLVPGWVAHARSWFCGGAVALDQVAVETAMSELWRSLVAGIPSPFSGGTFKLSLCILSFELCCSLSCAQPHPLLDLNHWLAFLAKPQSCLVTVGWLWWSWTVADPGFSHQTCSAFPVSVSVPASLVSEGTAPASVVVTLCSWLASSCRGGCP